MYKKKCGFTLIEILITTTIMIVLTGLSFAGYQYFNARKELEEGVKQVVEAIELARKLSITGQIPQFVLNSPQTCGPFYGSYEFFFSYAIYQIRGLSAGCYSYSDILFQKMYDKQGNALFYLQNVTVAVTGNYAPGSSNYSFTPFTGLVKPGDPYYSPLDVNGGFSLKLYNIKTPTIFKTISVSRSGTITIQ